MAITKRKIIKYAVLPQFWPRIRALLGSGFVHIAYLMASIYQSVRLLPPGHPYLNPDNFGKYGIRHVIAEAANNLVFSKKNIDQIIVFFTILVGVVLLLVQFVLLIIALISQPAIAGGLGNYLDWFGTNDPFTTHHDIAFIILDRVFGLENIYNSCIALTNVPCLDVRGNPLPTSGDYPFPIHLALRQLLMFYSQGMVIVATFIIIYFIITIVGETAATGTPFGQRFNKAWAPIRIIMFFALLAPLNIGGQNEGLNGAQLITFYTARWGSNFATNAWGRFNQVLQGTYLGEVQTLIATPGIPEVGALNQFFFVAKMCQIAEGAIHNIPIRAYIVREYVNGADFMEFNFPSYQQALNFSQNGNITIRFGELEPTFRANPTIGAAAAAAEAANFAAADAAVNLQININNAAADPNSAGRALQVTEARAQLVAAEAAANAAAQNATGAVSAAGLTLKNGAYKGLVNPLCGEITMHVTDVYELGSLAIQDAYFELLDDMWYDTVDGFAGTFTTIYAECVLRRTLPVNSDSQCTNWPDRAFAQLQVTTYDNLIRGYIQDGIADQIGSPDWAVPQPLLQKGWAGAAIWYNRIARMNGAVTTAVMNVPRPTLYPFVMEEIARQRYGEDEGVSGAKRFDPLISGNKLADLPREGDQYIASALYTGYKFWEQDGYTSTHHTHKSGNIVIDTINSILGTSGIYDMRENTDIHPLAQLSALGKGMIEATVRNVLFASVGVVTEGLGGLLEPFIGMTAKVAKSFFLSFTQITLTMGVILYYVLPFLPFIYFLFAVSGWIKSIFEAIVAMPLWAMAHIRIDGEGLPGPGATNGYFLLLEIFIRPTLIVFGLLASLTIFSAMVEVLNQIFDLIVTNVGGYNVSYCGLNQGAAGCAPGPGPGQIDFYRNPLDEFFFTAIYVIIVYMLGLSAFKLVDAIPNNILRWMGVTVSTFQEGAGDPASQLTSQVYKGATLATGKLSGGQLAALAVTK